jgi:hypothetical protein
MPRGLSTALLNELATQNIKPIALVEIQFPTPQYITNHYKDIVETDIWDDALGLWDDRDVTGVSTTIANITGGLTLSNTYQSLTNLGSITGRNQNIVFQTDSNGILLKSSYTDAEIWWEVGGSTTGAYLGIAKINDAYFIRFRAGSGRNTEQSTGGGTAGGSSARAVVNLSVSDSSVASYFDDERHIITWAIEVPDATYLAGRLRLWIDGNEVITYDPYNDDGNVFRSGQWAGSDSAGYGQGFSSIAGGDGTFDSGATQYQTFTGTSVGSDVYVFAYENQTIIYPVEVIVVEGTTGLWDNGTTYTASGHLLSIGGKSENSELDVSSFQIELSAVDSAFVSIVLNNNVSNDEVKIDIGLLNENDAIIGSFNYDKGFIESYSINTDTGRLILSCTSHFADFSRVAGRKTNSGSQQTIFANDKGMEFSALTVQDLKWGRK